MAETAPQPESNLDRVSRWLAQQNAPQNDVSHETSPEPKEEPEPEVTAAESDSEDDYQPEPNAHVEGDETEPEGIRSFSDLAKRLELDEEALAKHLVVTGRDGKEVPLHEVLTAYRSPAPEAAEVEQLRAHRAEFESGKAALAQEAEQLRQTAQAFAAQLQAREPNWAQLKAENQQGYLSARIEWMEHQRQLEQAAQQFEAVRARQQAEQQAQFAEFRRAEARKLQSAIPEWSDTKVMQRDLDGITQYLISQGIKPEEVENLTDHRDWLIARKAKAYDELQAQKPGLLKKVRELPKLITPGASSGADRGAAARDAQAESELFAQLKETGSGDTAAQLIQRRLSSSARRAAGRALATGRRS